MFGFIKNTLSKIYSQFTSKITSLFSRNSIDADTLKELELILIGADVGVKTTRFIIDQLKNDVMNGKIQKGADLKDGLKEQLLSVLSQGNDDPESTIYLLVGINGSGKTTFAGKLAHKLNQENKKVLFVAGDTFRAAAPEQLKQWAQRTKSEIVIGNEGQDPASVIFTAAAKFKAENFDVLIIDTAGRLQTKTNLMKELEKIRSVISKQIPNAKVCTLLTIDAMLGQNSFEQARLFYQSTQVNGIVLTKIDGTGKGGIIFSITKEFGIPVKYLSYGERIEDLKKFNPTEYVTDLLNE